MNHATHTSPSILCSGLAWKLACWCPMCTARQRMTAAVVSQGAAILARSGHCGGSPVSSPPPASSLTSLCPLLPSPHTPAAWPQLCACADWQKAASPRAWAQPHCSQQRPSICPPPGRHYPPAGHTALELCPVVFSSKNTSAAAGDSVRVSLCREAMVAAAALLLLEAAAASTLAQPLVTVRTRPPHTLYSFCADPSGSITASCISMKL